MRRTRKKGRDTEERKISSGQMEDRMNEMFREDGVADRKDDSLAGFTFICVNQFSLHNLIMSNSELSAWNHLIKKREVPFFPLSFKTATQSMCL